ncbi:unnamed protein product [Linum trigynum]|uniref:Uncharacterized protein n=1 Tax=Linum trigynum TaxID=586398 RepID=A0AAV2E6Z7_9ROSI
MIAGQELVGQGVPGGDLPRRSVVQPHLGLFVQSEWKVTKPNGVLRDPIDLDRINQLMEPTQVLAWALSYLLVKGHRTLQHYDDTHLHLKVFGNNMRMLDT